MPSSYTHQLIAEAVLARLKGEGKELFSACADYFLGAQGGDVLYFYNMAGREKNVGKYFHRRNVYGVFSSFLRSARGGDAHVRAYIAGYITHYAADTVFHPYIYHYCRAMRAETGKKRDHFHARAESDLDTYFVQTRAGVPVSGYRLPLRFDEICVPAVFAALAPACTERALTERGVRRAIARFLRVQAFFADSRRGRAVYAAESILHAPRVFSGLCRREGIDGRVLNGQHAPWAYPADPAVLSREGADELFMRSVKEGVRLVLAFFAAADGGGELDPQAFGKHFLTGLSGSPPYDERGEVPSLRR